MSTDTTTTTTTLVGELAKTDGEIREARERYAGILEALRLVCEHPVLLETGYQESRSGWFDGMLPLRICETCGVEEEGWSFRVLTGRAYKVARNDIYKARKHGPRTLVEK